MELSLSGLFMWMSLQREDTETVLITEADWLVHYSAPESFELAHILHWKIKLDTVIQFLGYFNIKFNLGIL